MSIDQSAIDLTITVPAKMRLRLNREKLQRNVGNRLATRLRKQWGMGRTGGGEPLPIPTSENTRRKAPLHVSGTLMKAVKYSRFYAFVMADNLKKDVVDESGKTRRISKRANSLFGLSRILISGKWRRRRDLGKTVQTKRGTMRVTSPGTPVRAPVDLYGDSAQVTIDAKQDYAQREISRQLKRNEAGIIEEAREVYRRGKRNKR